MTGEDSQVLVAGASGYLGSHICKNLLARGLQVHAWGRKKRSPVSKGCGQLIYNSGDITQESTLYAMGSIDPQIVIYCVSLNQSDCETDVRRAVEVNVKPLWNLVDRLLKNEGKSLRLVYLSTAHIYGNMRGCIRESSCVGPTSVYGVTHLMCEQVLERYSRLGLLDLSIARISNGYGPPLDLDQDCWSLAVNEFCRSAFQENEIRLRSEGHGERDFIFVDDVVTAISSMALSRSVNMSGIYNIGTGCTYKIRELAFLVARIYKELTGIDCPVIGSNGAELAEENQVTPSKSFVYDISAAKRVGISPKTPIREGVTSLLKFFEHERI
jgi:nucleoside-diphosphate-sugar epimerase